ncbi:shikimate dehydrogenase family protein [Agrococcus jejuensis]|uniref:Shikimate dehydrogenase n=1 Tax=Agrococcus jejuensis TaxID=399736 RepID=A0A1G7ZR60_9MICO|nr:shikimate dehydrogenase [Agrococcus jejuensis]SDH11165.1 shikimate dehydrogenase [Agrococcus jejuensis]
MRLAVIGDPIEHSRSPRIHAAAYAVLGLDWAYGRERLTADAVAGFVDGLGPEWRGLSVTAPLKEAAAAWARDVDPLVTRTGAANTLRVDLRAAWNTDVAGIVDAFAEVGVDGVDRGAIVGGGATAVSAVCALAAMGAIRVDAWLRTPAKGERLVTLGAELGVAVHLVGPDAPPLVGDVVVSTLPAEAAAAPALAGPRAILDADYASGASRYEGVAPLVPGLAMLLHQALRQVRIFVHGDPETPVDREGEVWAAMVAAA